MILSLVEHDVDGFQSHVYADWPEAGTADEDKKRLAEQVRTLRCVTLRPLFESVVRTLSKATHARENSHAVVITVVFV